MRTVVVVLAIVVLAGCGGQSKGAQPTTRAEAGGRIAGTTLDGNTVSLDQFRGRPVLVNVWSSW